MVSTLVDTSIVIDLLRGYPLAQVWFVSQNDLAVARVVWLEVIEGAPNQRAQRAAIQLLKRFRSIELESADVIWAAEKLSKFNLSHNVDAFDCLIAAVSYRLQLPLMTRNLKHFAPLLGSLAQRPY